MAVRVAFCITELDPGGAERALAEIVTRFDPTKWDVRVFCLGPETDLSRTLRDHGIETVCLGAVRPTQVGVLFRLARELRTFRPVILQTFLFHANIAGRLAGWWAGVPLILSGLRVAERKKRWHLWLDRWTNWMVKYNVCVSEGVRQFAQTEGGLAPQKLRVIPNGVDRERFAQAVPIDLSSLGVPSGAWVLVTVGRLTFQKGHDLLVEAVAPLLLEDPQKHLLIVGEGEQRGMIERMSVELGIASQVHCPGWQRDISGILKSCDAFVLPSRWEGMPNSLLEGMAAGLPCLAFDVEGVREILGTGEAGKMVTSGDVLALRMGVKELAESHDSAIAIESQDISVKRHTWVYVSGEYAALFAECIGER